MSEEIKNGQQLLIDARSAFQSTRYTNASVLFAQAAEALPGNLEAPMYAVVSKFMAGERLGAELSPVWEQVKAMLEKIIAEKTPAEVFAAAEEVKQAMAICTVAVYRSCNDRQKMEYDALNKDVKLENRDYIFDEIRRVLLEADEEYKACLQVIYAYAQLVCKLPDQEQAPESFFLAVLSYVQMAVDLQNESGLTKLFPQLDLGEFACGLELGEGMNDALAARNKLMQTVLEGEEALARWEFFAPYAQMAGVTRASVEKKVKRAQLLEKLKFWKKLKRK